ncbi:hypothetical protein EGW08_001237, partial [Elysia chlorotica]
MFSTFIRVFSWIVPFGFLYTTWAAPLELPCTKATGTCGKPVIPPISMRIIGGQPAVRGSWPWMASIHENGFAKCGGAIISEDLILTATHCFMSYTNDTSIWTISVGKYRMDRKENGEKTVKVSQIITHADFDAMTVANDIALVVLAERLVYSDVIQPICVPHSSQEVKVGEMCLLAGWGATRGTSDVNALNQVSLPIVSDSTCGQPDWYGMDFSQPDTTFCAGYEQGIKDGSDRNNSILHSRSTVWSETCHWGYGCAEEKWPGIYTEVNKYSSWIHSTI